MINLKFNFNNKEHNCPFCGQLVPYDKKHNRCLTFCNINCKSKYIIQQKKKNIHYCKICGKIAIYNEKYSRWSKLCDSPECKLKNSRQCQLKGIKNRNIIKIDKDLLRDLYINKNLSRKQLSEYFKCSEANIKKKLKEFNIIKGISLRNIHTRNTKLKKYNNSTFVNSKKRKQTCLKKYGVNNNLLLCKKSSKSKSKIEKQWLDSLKIDSLQFNYSIKVNNLKWYLPDGYDPRTNTVYEMLGDFWHGNLNIYKPNIINPISHKRMKTLFKETFERFNNIKSLGYNIIYIWENDFKNNKPYQIY